MESTIAMRTAKKSCYELLTSHGERLAGVSICISMLGLHSLRLPRPIKEVLRVSLLYNNIGPLVFTNVDGDMPIGRNYKKLWTITRSSGFRLRLYGMLDKVSRQTTRLIL